MQRLLLITTVLLLVVGILVAAHYYIWARLVRDVGWSPNVRRPLTLAVIGLALSIPASFVLARQLPPNHGRAILYVTYTWLGSVLTLLLVLAASDLMRFVIENWIGGGLEFESHAERRLFLKRFLAAGAMFVTGTSTIFAVKEALSEVKVKNVRVSLSRLPAALNGFTIVQITDLHVGPTIRTDFVRTIVSRVNALDADLVAITGDLVDGTVAHLREMVASLSKLRARHGVFFVTGNHEYYSGVDEWIAEIRRLGITVLRNERVSIGSARGSFDLIGVDDAHARQFGNGHGADLSRAVRGRDPKREAVLLAHQPRAVFDAVRHGIGLQLSGHTHGGQIWPFGWFVRLQQPVVKGLAKIESVWLYVSAGTGYWGPPMRRGAPAEITRVVLLSEQA